MVVGSNPTGRVINRKESNMLGLCCHWLNEKEKNTLKTSSLSKNRYLAGKYDNDRIKNTYVGNLTRILEHLPIINNSGIKVFRMSSSAFPLFDIVDSSLWNNDEVNNLLSLIGDYVKKNGMRITTHPGQFTVMSSDNPRITKASASELNFHGLIFDRMGLDRNPFYAINIHGGGKAERAATLVYNIERYLGAASKSRLTLENCEFGWSVLDLLEISETCSVPICYDSHHHTFNDGGISGKEALLIAKSTWPKGIKPLTHLSNVKEGVEDDAPRTKRRQHSDYIYYLPEHQAIANNAGEIDIDIEAKKKNLAVFRAVELGLTLQ